MSNMRLSGLMSGIDTESIISQLVEARKVKVTKAVKEQKSLKYKQDAWKDMNAKIVKLYNGSLGNMRFESSFIKKITKVSNPNIVSVITGEKAMNSVQSLRVDKLAQSGYLTGSELKNTEGGKVTEDTKLSELGLGAGVSGTIEVKVGDTTKKISVNENTTVKSFVDSLKEAGLNANFDETNQRFYIASKSSGIKNDFVISASNEGGLAALESLGISYVDDAVKKVYQDVIDNQATTLAGRLDARLESLKESRTAALDKREDLLNTLSKYATVLDAKLQELNPGTTVNIASIEAENLDEATMAELKAAITAVVDEAKANAEAGAAEGEEPEIPELVKDLSTWATDWESNEKALATVNDQMVITTTTSTDAEGNEVVTENFALAADVEQEITNAVDAEVAQATAMLSSLDSANATAKKTAGSDARIYLNDVMYESSKNSFEINGLTLTVNSTTAKGEAVTITTEEDTQGIYDMIKNFLSEYNKLINEMDKMYNADSASEYEPLTEEEKDAMSETEVEEWEQKIKDAILRKDGSLGTISGAMKEIMMSGITVNGEKMYLSSFGIETLGYFNAEENERNAYHIAGDPDDEKTSGNADKLKTMIANDPDTVVSFFTQLSKTLYDRMTDLMASSDYSSAYTAYEDKKMKTDYDNYTDKIEELEAALTDYEDKWYAKFAAMETAMAKMQSNSSAVTNMLGGM